MVLILFILFALISVFLIFDFNNKIVKNVFTIVLAIILILFAGFRVKDMDNDFYVYRDYWRTHKLFGKVEYSFYIIREFLKNTLSLEFRSLLLTYAFLGVSVKFAAIRKFAPLLWGSLLVYMSHYFLLHEFTQIRIGVATGFLLFSIYFISEKKYLLYLVFASLSILFHQSCVLVLLFPFIRNSEKNLWIFSLLILLAMSYIFLILILILISPFQAYKAKLSYMKRLQSPDI